MRLLLALLLLLAPAALEAGGSAHADGEWADLKSLPRQAIRAALLIDRLSRAR